MVGCYNAADGCGFWGNEMSAKRKKIEEIKNSFTLKQAGIEDIQRIQDLLYPHYFKESGYRDLDYDPLATATMIYTWIKDGVGLIVESDGKAIGFASIGFMRTFYKQAEADVDMFFILPEYRATGAARMLSKSLAYVADKGNAKVVYTSCLSELGENNNKMYENLWSKLGFRKLGTVMIRS